MRQYHETKSISIQSKIKVDKTVSDTLRPIFQRDRCQSLQRIWPSALHCFFITIKFDSDRCAARRRQKTGRLDRTRSATICNIGRRRGR